MAAGVVRPAAHNHCEKKDSHVELPYASAMSYAHQSYGGYGVSMADPSNSMLPDKYCSASPNTVPTVRHVQYDTP